MRERLFDPDTGAGRASEGLRSRASAPHRNELRHTPRSPSPFDEDWPHRRRHLGRLPLDPLRFGEAVDAVEALVESGRGGTVFLPDAGHLVLAETQGQAAFRDALARATLCLPDGQRLMWAAETLGAPLVEDVPAGELFVPLMSLAGRRRWRVFMLGSDEGALEAAAARVERLYGARVVGVHAAAAGALGSEEAVAAAARSVLRTSPQLVLTSLPSPSQELFCDALRARVGPAVCVGLGPALDPLAARTWRGPQVIRRAGLGWLVRLFAGPRRLGRRGLWGDVRFLWVLARLWLSGRRTGAALPEAFR